MYVGFGAEQMLPAEKEGQQTAIEVKSFVGHSEVDDLENALGQYLLYRSLMQRRPPERTLYLAVPRDAFHGVFSAELGCVVR